MIILHDTITGVSDVFGLGHDDHFFREQNLYIHCFDDSMVVRDLADALQPGREVISHTVRFLGWKGEKISHRLDIWLFNNRLTLAEFVKLLMDGGSTLPISFFDMFHVSTRSVKGVRVFSPFVNIKPIKVPKKWTLAHVWKAILSEQITHGKINMILTDDYARDAADNFHIDKKIDLMQFARELVTDSDGWRVYRMGDSEDVIKLGLSYYSFDLRTLYFARP